MRIAITGSASGIGAAVASTLKQQGAHITAFDIEDASAQADHYVPLDLADANAIEQAIAEVQGTFDGVVNAAGLPPREGLEKTVLAVNYTGLVMFSNALEGRLNKGASIVNVASRAGAMWMQNIEQVKALMALPQGVAGFDSLDAFIEANDIDYVRAYNLSKEAVIVWTMAQCERLLANDIRINSISPAAVETRILGDFKQAFGARVEQALARVGRAGTTLEVADVICFLLSPQSAWLKGIDIRIDGGMGALALSDQLDLRAR